MFHRIIIIFCFLFEVYNGIGQIVYRPYIPLKKSHIDSANFRHYKAIIELNSNNITPFNSFYKYYNTAIGYYHLEAENDTVMKYFDLAFDADGVQCCPNFFVYPYSLSTSIEKPAKRSVLNKFKIKCDSLYKTFDSTLILLLDTIKEYDSRIRDNYPPEIVNDKKTWSIQQKLDSINQQRIEGIIKKVGYPGRRKVGLELEDVVFYVIMHGDSSMQEHYLPIMREAVKQRELRRRNLPYLEDRVLMQKGLPQLYGTQFIFNKKKKQFELYKVYDLENVDKRREEMDLYDIKTYMQKSKVTAIQK